MSREPGGGFRSVLGGVMLSRLVRIVVNRADTRGALTASRIERLLGRQVDAEIPSEWDLVSTCNAEGIPFVRERPDSPATEAIDRLA
ncbi:MAG: hypothetical protein ACXV3T_06765, partial [Halobacteriota archaeon]